MNLKDIKFNQYGKRVSIRGCVIRVGKRKLIPSTIEFTCIHCDFQMVADQPNGKYTFPKKCTSCGKGKWQPILDSPLTKTIDFQVIRIQEHFDDEQNSEGTVPRVFNVELSANLVDACMPGDDVSLSGIIKMQGRDNGIVKDTSSITSALYMEADSIANNNKTENKQIDNINLCTQDYITIKEIYDDTDMFGLLVQSLCPGIYGHEIVKAGLVLSLFGGSSKSGNLRDTIHVLAVGDPGLGKSQMLQACSRVAPKAVYISGNCSTASGLTVTLLKESGSNSFALQPGALVLADRGSCCIDEFDKMPNQHTVLLEAMEQQCISVAKSGVIWSLPARASILAAANPIGGRYNKAKSICTNLNISQPLLSRFDLIFLLLDQPNHNWDEKLCAHVLNLHTTRENQRNVSERNSFASDQFDGRDDTLKDKLKNARKGKRKLIPNASIRKYISYARKFVKSTLSMESAVVLEKFFLDLRKKGQVGGNILICTRHYEGLIRLTEARARLDLRENTTKQDAIDVIEIFKETVIDTHSDLQFNFHVSEG